VFKDAQHHLSPFEEAKRYQLHSPTPDAGYAAMMHKFVTEAILPYAFGHTALDFGAGRIGLLGTLIRKVGYIVSEYDTFVTSDLYLLSRPYDLVTLVEVAEHFQTPADEFALLANLVAPKGTLAIRTGFAVPDLGTWWYIRDTTHYSFYSDRTFAWVADKYGFTIRYSNHRDTIVLQKR